MNKKTFLLMLFFSRCIESEEFTERSFSESEVQKHEFDLSLPMTVEPSQNIANFLFQPDAQASFLKKIYQMQKNSNYLEYKFTQAGWPMVDLLKSIGTLQIDLWYGLCRAISNSTKACLYIRAAALNNVLNVLASVVQPHMESLRGSNQEVELEAKIEKAISVALHENKTSSVQNLTKSISKEVVGICNEWKEKPMVQYTAMTRELLYGFLDSLISRATWEPSDYSTVWDSLLTAANYLYQMPAILETCDKLDNLILSLIHAFIKFLDINLEALPIAFLENIRASITQREAFFLEDPESDDFVLSKKDLLLNKIDQFISKKRQLEIKPWHENVDKIALMKKPEPLAKPFGQNLFENV